jgi:hypothetical protein
MNIDFTKSLSTYNSSLFLFFYIVVFPFKFLTFYSKFHPICSLMEAIKGKLTEKSSKRMEKYERQLTMGLNIYLFLSFSNEVFYFYDLFAKTEMNPIELWAQILSVFSDFALEFTTILMGFIFFDISMHICVLLEQIEDDLVELESVENSSRVKKVLGEVCEFHNEIQGIVEEFSRCFGNVLQVVFVLAIWLNAQATIFMLESQWVELILFLPFMLFDTWLYCYASQRMITKVGLV